MKHSIFNKKIRQLCLLIVATFFVYGCQLQQADEKAMLDSNQKIWDASNLDHYEYTYMDRFCIQDDPCTLDLKSVYRVQVIDNRVTQVTNITEQASEAVLNSTDGFYTIDDLFLAVLRDISDSRIRYTDYNGELGYPEQSVPGPGNQGIQFKVSDLVEITDENVIAENGTQLGDQMRVWSSHDINDYTFTIKSTASTSLMGFNLPMGSVETSIRVEDGAIVSQTKSTTVGFIPSEVFEIVTLQEYMTIDRLFELTGLLSQSLGRNSVSFDDNYGFIDEATFLFIPELNINLELSVLDFQML